METLSIRLNFGVTAASIYYEGRRPKIFLRKTGDEKVGPRDPNGWIDFGEKEDRIQLFRSQIDHTLWLDRKEYLLEKKSLPTQMGIYSLGPSYWPPMDLIRSLGLQSYTPARRVAVEFTPETTWTTTLRSGRKV